MITNHFTVQCNSEEITLWYYKKKDHKPSFQYSMNAFNNQHTHKDVCELLNYFKYSIKEYRLLSEQHFNTTNY